jgi:hypothetical protein
LTTNESSRLAASSSLGPWAERRPGKVSSSTRQQGFAQPLSYDQSRGLSSRREASSRQAACNRGAANLIAGAGPGATTELRRLKASNKLSSIFSASLAASQGTTPVERRARRVGIYKVIQAITASWSQGQIGIERIVSSLTSADPVTIITGSLSTASTPPAPQKRGGKTAPPSFAA